MARKPKQENTTGADMPPEYQDDFLDIAPDQMQPQQNDADMIWVQCAARVGAAVWLKSGGVLRNGDRIKLPREEAEGLLLSGAVLPV